MVPALPELTGRGLDGNGNHVLEVQGVNGFEIPIILS